MRWRGGLDERDANKILKKAATYYRQTYDPYFTMGTDRQYCSELVWRAYGGAEIKLGMVQKTGDLALNSAPVRALINVRWKMHPLCAGGKVKEFEGCWQHIIKEDIVTPASLAEDKNLTVIFSNYP